MPQTIKILPQFIANRIAAGEVVGRPEAVVKELTENSIDAGAKNIWVRVKDAGKSFIQVTDDACGMSDEDALMCFQRHSTSKISKPEDLEHISTLGFRGEALASICAVSQVELKSRTSSTDTGSFIKNHGSEVIGHTQVQSETGTSVTVKNLFYNTPARRNFLKTNQTEFRHIYDTFIRQAISNPGIGFSLVNDDEEIFNLEPAGLKERLAAIYGKDLESSLLEINSDNSLIKLNGFISKPSFTKKSKNDQLLFLNNRYVVNKNLVYAVHLAYQDLIEKGDYPNFFLFITLDTVKFDVNVHPSKLEVKFDDERAVFGFIMKSVRNVLKDNDLIVSTNLNETSFPQQIFSSRVTGKQIAEIPHSNYSSGFSFTHTPQKSSNIHELINLAPAKEENEPPEGQNTSEVFNVRLQTAQNLSAKSSIWQFQKKYIMYQMENTLMIIDQHAAHERVLYEQAVERLDSNANLTQQLLIPIYIELNPVDYEVAKGIQTELRALGFDLEFQSKRKIKMQGIPSDVHLGHEERILQDLIDEFKENDVKLNLEKRENLAKSYACKHAIRTGDVLNQNEMLNLIDKLFSMKMPYVCPHGRPTIIKIPIEELDKKFARTGF